MVKGYLSSLQLDHKIGNSCPDDGVARLPAEAD
jgi:hypothetical protein